MKTFFKLILCTIILCIVVVSLYFFYLGPIDNKKIQKTFIIPQKTSDFDLSAELYKNNLIKNEKAFRLLLDVFYKDFEVKEGGYYLNTSLSSNQIIQRLLQRQDMMWVNIFFCPRKEQVGEKLAAALGWSSSQLNEWNNLYKDTEYYEGVYYPDTYLIPTNESTEQVAQRFINNFESKFNLLSNDYLEKNIKWTTGVKIASLIAREAAGREDMHLISGIIWNRLNQNMRLQIDATMQYTLGKDESGSWWGNISLREKQSDSPYNSYKHEGLPPTPICSPNIEFIEAALNPTETDCLFYLHDKNRNIYCSKTYEEHRENIQKYLK